MSDKPKNSDHAFPFAYEDRSTPGMVKTVACEGMSLRDWFAGMALSRLVHEELRSHEQVAKLAYSVADAMLAERKRVR